MGCLKYTVLCCNGFYGHLMRRNVLKFWEAHLSSGFLCERIVLQYTLSHLDLHFCRTTLHYQQLPSKKKQRWFKRILPKIIIHRLRSYWIYYAINISCQVNSTLWNRALTTGIISPFYLNWGVVNNNQAKLGTIHAFT